MARFQIGAEHLAALRKWGRLAQLVEQLTLNQRVVGSNPSASTIYLQINHRFIDLFSTLLNRSSYFRFRIGSGDCVKCSSGHSWISLNTGSLHQLAPHESPIHRKGIPKITNLPK
jgi:hypothetical protein